MEDRRLQARKKLPFDIALRAAHGDDFIGFLVDISATGLRLTGDEPFMEGTELELKMSLPDHWAAVSEIDFTAQCCWWENNDEDEGYTAGFRIIEMDDTEAFVMQEILELYGNPL